MKMIEPKYYFDWKSIPEGKDVNCYQKSYKEVAFLYDQKNQLDPDTIMYTVYSILEKPIPGHLMWGLSVLHPVRIGNECNMTRGHFHENMECEEYYWGMSGQGLLMLMDASGYCWAEKVYPGSLHHINGHIAHRLVNTSDDDLEVVCCWGADAGHDYERTEKMPFPYRVYKINGEIVVQEQKHKKYEFDAVIHESEDNGGAYIVFPWNIRKEFGKGRVKVHAEFDGQPYDGSIVNMGITDKEGHICYVIGVVKSIRKSLDKKDGDCVHVRIVER